MNSMGGHKRKAEHGYRPRSGRSS